MARARVVRLISLLVILAGSTVSEAMPIRNSNVVTNVSESGGVYTYNYTVQNTSPVPGGNFWPLIVGYELPLNSPADVFDIVSPPNWDHQFLSADEYDNPFKSAYVIRWYDTDPPPGGGDIFLKTISPDGFNATFPFVLEQHEPELSGFGFSSLSAPVDGPFQSLFLDLAPFLGDPPLPGGQSNSSATSGGSPAFQQLAIPESSALLIWLTMAIAVVALSRGRMTISA